MNYQFVRFQQATLERAACQIPLNLFEELNLDLARPSVVRSSTAPQSTASLSRMLSQSAFDVTVSYQFARYRHFAMFLVHGPVLRTACGPTLGESRLGQI